MSSSSSSPTPGPQSSSSSTTSNHQNTPQDSKKFLMSGRGRASTQGGSLRPEVEKKDFVRLIVQSLSEMGYKESASFLEKESGVRLQSDSISRFQENILQGRWDQVVQSIPHLGIAPQHLPQVKFLIYEQKFLELLELQKTIEALQCLRHELATLNPSPSATSSSTSSTTTTITTTPNLNSTTKSSATSTSTSSPPALRKSDVTMTDASEDIKRGRGQSQNKNVVSHNASEKLTHQKKPYKRHTAQLHRLSSYILCSNVQELMTCAQWDGANGFSRHVLLDRLRQFIPSHELLPPGRLLTLVSQAFQYQKLNCLFHNGQQYSSQPSASSFVPIPSSFSPSSSSSSSSTSSSSSFINHFDDHPNSSYHHHGRPVHRHHVPKNNNGHMQSNNSINGRNNDKEFDFSNKAINLTLVQLKSDDQNQNHTNGFNGYLPLQYQQPWSLFEDHSCSKSTIPTETTHILEGHIDEVWFVSFSHSGLYLASASKDSTAIIWDISSFLSPSSSASSSSATSSSSSSLPSSFLPTDCPIVHRLSGHSSEIPCLSWSPDDSLLLTCGNDKLVKCWDLETGSCKFTFNRHTGPVSACAWLPDGRHFVSGSSDKFIYLVDSIGQEVCSWQCSQITDLAVSGDGKKMVTIDQENKIRIYDLENRSPLFQCIPVPALTECHKMSVNVHMTSLSLSQDGNYALINTSGVPEFQIWDLNEKIMVRKLFGHKQTSFVIRGCFGGAEQALIASGSEDSQVYIWHRSRGSLLCVLPGHSGTVNAVTWNPVNISMFASASDDHTIRIWQSKDVISSLMTHRNQFYRHPENFEDENEQGSNCDEDENEEDDDSEMSA